MVRNRPFSVLVSIGYVLTITASALFHNHGGSAGNGCDCCAEGCAESHSSDCNGHGNDRSTPHSPGDCEHCVVCQFMAQKPAPPAELPPPQLETAVAELVEVEPTLVFIDVAAAWRSRAPPAVA